jgi:hypothetical protein
VSLCFFNLAPHYESVLGEWRYSSAHSLTSALDRGERSASRPSRFTPKERGKDPPVPIGQEAGWAPEPFWTRWCREKFPAPAGNRTLEPRPSSPYPSAIPTTTHPDARITHGIPPPPYSSFTLPHLSVL